MFSLLYLKIDFIVSLSLFFTENVMDGFYQSETLKHFVYVLF